MTIADSCFLMENEASYLQLPPEEENLIIAELMKKSESNLKEGNLYYVISNRWFSRWQRYIGPSVGIFSTDDQSSDSQHCHVAPSKIADRPGPIDNLDIVLNERDFEGNDLEILKMLEEGLDYVLVPQEVWEKLLEWYKGGPALPRKLISQGLQQKKYNVEVYPLCLKVIDSRDNSQSVIKFSRKATIRELYEKVCIVSGVEQEKACIWDYFNKYKSSSLLVSDQTLEETNLMMDQDILLEVQVDADHSSQSGMVSTGNEWALVPLEPSRSSLSIAGGPAMSNGDSSGYRLNLYQGISYDSGVMDVDDRNDIYKGEKVGMAGLQNLGNTCFMNSALQCLVHTPPIHEYFLQDYSEEINTENPLGMHGELAISFGELLRKLWSSGRTTVAPRVFKGKLAQFAPQFSGYNQHDSQELLAYLLDGLHEDLNRVKQKPYIEMKDSKDRPDEEVALECWNNHNARNDSLIVDVCQGQYKSTLVCPSCGKISITFDPFMYLSLPLPSTLTRSMTVTVIYGNGSGLPMAYTLTVLRHGCCKDLVHALGTVCFLKSDEMLLLAEVYEHQIYRYLDIPLQPLTSIKDDEHIVAYRFKKGAQKTKLEVVHRWLEKCGPDNMKIAEKKFGTPLVTFLGEDALNGADIDVAVYRMLSPLKRAYSSTKSLSDNENGFVSAGSDEPSNSYNAQSGLGNLTMDNKGVQGVTCGDLCLFLTDERGVICKPIEKDFVINTGIIRVSLLWTGKEHEVYDASCLRDLPEIQKTGVTVKKTRQEAISLFSCLEAFLREEPLGPDDMWYCPRCKDHRQATKKLDLWKLPEILVFHLKRFSYSRYLKNKLDTVVNFPIHNLDLTKYVRSKDGHCYVYELYAISNHYGGLGGGHYTAYAKLVNENRWYHFDDSHVSEVVESEIKSSAAYVLFYERVRSVPTMGGETSKVSSGS
ncbi:Ubiquitin carboxyl-terminal hydrolase [Quillaja saponaria]|uniref:Ubiquitin carboxyl-terminal hydrolase n=1 Tax=Quillaja saponaria TaxID=32244 RepID=A0AAD7L626_QUISA|nr:Ubiquitin carboxyl-terminal hydrolase [Quillaja saponaria]